MKTKITFLLISLFLFTPFYSCAQRITPSKNYITEEVKVNDFNGIKSDIVGNIYYVQSDIISVKIYGPDNIVPLIKAESKGSTLHLSGKKNLQTKRKYEFKVFISGPTLNEIIANGVGNIYLKEKVETGTISIANNGVGNVEIEKLTCEKAKLKLTGVGDIKIKGECNTAEYKLTGVGNISAYDFKVNDLKINTDGVGDVKCSADHHLTINHSGVGGVNYKGNAAVEQKKKGIGKIKKVN